MPKNAQTQSESESGTGPIVEGRRNGYSFLRDDGFKSTACSSLARASGARIRRRCFFAGEQCHAVMVFVRHSCFEQKSSAQNVRRYRHMADVALAALFLNMQGVRRRQEGNGAGKSDSHFLCSAKNETSLEDR